jgi:tetratricopeptide (TPR) repeat protein
MALLRLAQGNVKAAQSLIDRALSADQIALDRIKLLPSGVAIALAASDVGAARSLADELQSLAAGYESTVFLARAAHAEGAVTLTQGNPEDAIGAFTRACSLWKEAGMPYDEARTRSLMAEAYWAGGEDDLADLEARAAQKVFDKLGALPDLERINGLIEDHS